MMIPDDVRRRAVQALTDLSDAYINKLAANVPAEVVEQLRLSARESIESVVAQFRPNKIQELAAWTGFFTATQSVERADEMLATWREKRRTILGETS